MVKFNCCSTEYRFSILAMPANESSVFLNVLLYVNALICLLRLANKEKFDVFCLYKPKN